MPTDGAPGARAGAVVWRLLLAVALCGALPRTVSAQAQEAAEAEEAVKTEVGPDAGNDADSAAEPPQAAGAAEQPAQPGAAPEGDAPVVAPSGEDVPAAAGPATPQAEAGKPESGRGTSLADLGDPPCPAVGSLEEIAYTLERVEVRGIERTKESAVKSFVPVDVGGALDVDDPSIEALRYRLLGTGWFDSVHVHLERGSRPGRVTLVIDVHERNTLVIQQLAAGVGWSVGNVSDGGNRAGRRPQPYLGAALADFNFLGTGREIGLEFLVSPEQQGFALDYSDPLFRSRRWSLSTRALFTSGQEYFGGDQVFAAVNCDPTILDGDAERDCEAQPPAAVVDYWRSGLQLTGIRDVGVFTHLSFGYRGDFVRVPPGKMPAAASTERGRGDDPLRRQPIDFSVEPGNSYSSMLSVGVTYDRRDSTATPTKGSLATFAGDLSSSLLGSDYDFVRLQTSYHRWRSLGSGHVLRGGAYVGTIFGQAPFFYQFFVADLSDLVPSRILGLNLDHRPAPNLAGLLESGRAFDDSTGTAIAQMRIEDLAARVDAEYVWPFKRGGSGFVKSGDLFVLLGLYMLADTRDFRTSVPGYRGLARLPVDLTFDVGFRLDTRWGVFRFGLAKLGWLPVTGSTVGGNETPFGLCVRARPAGFQLGGVSATGLP